MKKYILLITFLFFTLNLSSCDRDPEESSQIIFSDADAVMSMRGYAATAQIDTMSFFFKYDDYEANSYFVHSYCRRMGYF